MHIDKDRGGRCEKETFCFLGVARLFIGFFFFLFLSYYYYSHMVCIVKKKIYLHIKFHLNQVEAPQTPRPNHSATKELPPCFVNIRLLPKGQLRASVLKKLLQGSRITWLKWAPLSAPGWLSGCSCFHPIIRAESVQNLFLAQGAWRDQSPCPLSDLSWPSFIFPPPGAVPWRHLSFPWPACPWHVHCV